MNFVEALTCGLSHGELAAASAAAVVESVSARLVGATALLRGALVVRAVNRVSSSRRANAISAHRNGGCGSSPGLVSAFWCAQSIMLLTTLTMAVMRFGFLVVASSSW